MARFPKYSLIAYERQGRESERLIFSISDFKGKLVIA
jgi:hypothetical protein